MGAKKEFKDKPISTTCSILTGIAALIVIVTFTWSLFSVATTGELPFKIPTSSKSSHSISANLQPELSSVGQIVDYTIEFCNDANSSLSVNGIRIFENKNYSDFKCIEKEGWYLIFINESHCRYYAEEPYYYIDPGECKTFRFEARTPESGCEMIWKFETIDTNYFWLYVYDITKIDTC